MIRTLHIAATLAVTAIGVVHTASTFVFFREPGEEAIWFAGTGLAAITTGILNMILWSAGERTRRNRVLVSVGNVLLLGLMAAGVVLMPGVPTALFSAAVLLLAITGARI
ncbi:MAG: hypothetical protein ABIK65_11485 [Candidatus Eisenbacteria bacterium]